jgi:hypothetical protein
MCVMLRANHRTAVLRGGQAEHAAHAGRGQCVRAIEQGAVAVEACQATDSSDPEITVAGLGKCLDGVLGKAILELPDAPRVLPLHNSIERTLSEDALHGA